MRGERRETNRTIWLLIPSAVSLGIAGVEQPYQVRRMIGGIGDMFVSVQCSECQSDEISNNRSLYLGFGGERQIKPSGG